MFGRHSEREKLSLPLLSGEIVEDVLKFFPFSKLRLVVVGQWSVVNLEGFYVKLTKRC